VGRAVPDARDRYPLSWPLGWKRTSRHDRKRASFQSARQAMTIAAGLRRLLGELGRLGVAEGDWVISTNVPTRLDGLPYAQAREPDDPGVAVYFRLKKQDRVLACDTWTRVADNLTAVAQHIDALRRIDRYGVGTLEQAFAGYQALPAKGQTWRATLGFGPTQDVSEEAIDAAYWARAKVMHPDVPQTGSHDAMATLNEARADALREVRA